MLGAISHSASLATARKHRLPPCMLPTTVNFGASTSSSAYNPDTREIAENKCSCNGTLFYASSIFSAFAGITLLVFGAMSILPGGVREPFLIIGALLLIAAMVLMVTGIHLDNKKRRMERYYPNPQDSISTNLDSC